MPTPRTTTVFRAPQLATALRDCPRYFARPVWSRGGLELFTNAVHSPARCASATASRACCARGSSQEFIDGEDLCSFSVARHGRVVAHCTYVHPKVIECAGGIVFESVRDPEALACVARVVAARDITARSRWTSSADRVGSSSSSATRARRRACTSCRSRCSSTPCSATSTARWCKRRPGYAACTRRRWCATPRSHPTRLRDALAYLLSEATDIYGEAGDRMPALFQVLSYGSVLSYRMRHRERARARDQADGRLLRRHQLGRSTDELTSHARRRATVDPSCHVTLVLGAGGVVGRAFHAGVLRALADRWGWDARSADLDRRHLGRLAGGRALAQRLVGGAALPPRAAGDANTGASPPIPVAGVARIFAPRRAAAVARPPGTARRGAVARRLPRRRPPRRRIRRHAAMAGAGRCGFRPSTSRPASASSSDAQARPPSTSPPR